MKNDPENPIETIESMRFATWLKANGLNVSGHVSNETRTPYKGELMKLKKMGVTKGIPDFIIFIPADRCIVSRSILLFVEMKRKKGFPSDVKVEQRMRLDALNEVMDVESFVAFGSDKAIEYVSSLLLGDSIITF